LKKSVPEFPMKANYYLAKDSLKPLIFRSNIWQNGKYVYDGTKLSDTVLFS